MTTATDEATATDEVLEGELLPAPEPLSESKAKALTKKIHTACTKVSNSINTAQDSINALGDLLDEAEQGQIHLALDLPSWPAYLEKYVSIEVADRLERKKFVALMTGKGMSQRAIAGALNVSKKTVQNDQVDTENPPEVIGIDGKTQPRQHQPKPAEQEPEPPTEVIDLPKQPLSREYANEVDVLVAGVESFAGLVKQYMDDERYPTAHNRIAKTQRPRITHCINTLEVIADHLGGDAE